MPAVCLMAGIALGEALNQWATGLALLTLTVIIALLLHRLPRWQTVAIGACCILLGATLASRTRQQYDIAWSDQPMTIEAVVVSEPVVKERLIVVDLLAADGRWKLRGRIVRDSMSERITIGNGLQLHSIINNVRAYKNGHFDYQRYMLCHGFHGETFARSSQWQWKQLTLEKLPVTERARLRFLCWRHQLLRHYREWGFDGDTYSVIAAMTLGEKSQLDAQLKDTFSRVGASHILALSGLHLMIIYAVVTLFVGWRRFRLASQASIVLAIWAFAFLVGLTPSVVRSALMITVYALLSLGYRERMSVNTLAFTAIVMLAANPMSLYDIGFQLSFMAVLSILLFLPLFGSVVPPHVLQRHRWLAYLWSLLTVSLAAQMGTAPLVAYYFGRFSCYFLLSNLVVVPLATAVLYLTLVCIACYWWTTVWQWTVMALAAVVALMNRLLQFIALLPGCSIEGISLSTLQLALLYVLLGCVYVLARLRTRRRSWCDSIRTGWLS